MKLKTTKSGFTLLEILIAVTIFVFLAVLLAELLQKGLDLWKTGETGGDISERGQIIMEQIKKDLSNIFTEPDKRTIVINKFDESLTLEKSYLLEPSLYCGVDKQGNPWLYLIRLDDDNLYTFISPAYQKSKQRITYYISGTSTAEPQLVRGIVDENTAKTFWEQGLDKQGDIPSAQTSQTFDDILYLGCTCYDSQNPSNPSITWDSRTITETVQTDDFVFPVIPQNLPRVVKTALDIKSLPLNAPKIKLVKDNGGLLDINISKSLLGAGNYIKIGTEWLLVQKKSGYNLTVSRGVRDTSQMSHGAGDEVQYGETIKETIYLSTAKTE
jgi:prepilin-type N-terminal cleavage/methylation domain-containing protein